MSILEKLKDLVAAIETEEVPQDTDIKKQVEDIDDPIEAAAPKNLDEQEDIEEFPHYLECSQEESVEIYDLYHKIDRNKKMVADLLLAYEAKKTETLNEIAVLTSQFYSKLNSLRLEYGVPKEGYSVELPSSPEDKVSFKKD